VKSGWLRHHQCIESDSKTEQWFWSLKQSQRSGIGRIKKTMVGCCYCCNRIVYRQKAFLAIILSLGSCNISSCATHTNYFHIGILFLTLKWTLLASLKFGGSLLMNEHRFMKIFKNEHKDYNPFLSVLSAQINIRHGNANQAEC